MEHELVAMVFGGIFCGVRYRYWFGHLVTRNRKHWGRANRKLHLMGANFRGVFWRTFLLRTFDGMAFGGALRSHRGINNDRQIADSR